MRKSMLIAISVVLFLFIAGCANSDNIGMPNPASKYCIENNGTLEIRENNGGEYGVCIFDNGGECEEWAFFRGECSKEISTIDSFEECVNAGHPVMESYPRQCSDGKNTFVEELSIDKQCEINGGKWLEEYFECEEISEEKCKSMGGVFNECESACRHSSAEICSMVCVKVCDLEFAIERQACEEQGGEYLNYIHRCNMRTTDFGNKCMNSRECEGLCLVNGICSEWTINLGCTNVLEDGKEVTICKD